VVPAPPDNDRAQAPEPVAGTDGEPGAGLVRAIFDMFVREGASLRLIAQRLTAADVPSPSAYDPARNRHRNPHGWAFGAVRAILSNPTYTGYRIWGKQQKVESLIDPDDVAAGNRSFMRWRDRDAWVRSDEPTHERPVTEEVFEEAQLKFAAKERPAARRARNARSCDRFSPPWPDLLRDLRFTHAGGVPGVQA